jgi:methionine-S-sulfoxide reductase
MLRRTFTAVLAAAALAGVAMPMAQAQSAKAVATFGSGCFWCTESDFDKVEGVLETTSGFMGGTIPNPSYDMVVSGKTGHVEVVQVTYDPAKVSYKQLLDTYWKNVDPFDANGQFCDKGTQYRPVIFVHDGVQKAAADTSKADKAKELAQRFKFPVVVSIEDAKPFTAAEEYHQNFYKKNASHYSRYRTGCGRDARLKQIWGALVTN